MARSHAHRATKTTNHHKTSWTLNCSVSVRERPDGSRSISSAKAGQDMVTLPSAGPALSVLRQLTKEDHTENSRFLKTLCPQRPSSELPENNYQITGHVTRSKGHFSSQKACLVFCQVSGHRRSHYRYNPRTSSYVSVFSVWTTYGCVC